MVPRHLLLPLYPIYPEYPLHLWLLVDRRIQWLQAPQRLRYQRLPEDQKDLEHLDLLAVPLIQEFQDSLYYL